MFEWSKSLLRFPPPTPYRYLENPGDFTIKYGEIERGSLVISGERLPMGQPTEGNNTEKSLCFSIVLTFFYYILGKSCIFHHLVLY